MLKYVAQGYVNTDTERKSGPALDVVVDNWLVCLLVVLVVMDGWMDVDRSMRAASLYGGDILNF